MNLSLTRLRPLLVLFALVAATPLLQAQERPFPSKQIRIVVPFAVGRVGDVLARIVASQLSERFGQQVIVENPVGGNAIPGTTAAARAPADGHTILQVTSAQIVNMVLRDKLPYDLQRDFMPVSRVAGAPIVLVVGGSHPSRSVAELIAYSRTKKDGTAFASGAVGSTGHLSGEMFRRAADFSAIHVSYSNASLMTDVISGRVDFAFLPEPDVLPQIGSGNLRALAVTSTQRLAAFPGVPTVAELGLKGFEPTLSYGYMVPRGTPEPVVRQLHAAIAASLGAPAQQERLRALGFVTDLGGPAEYAETIRRELRLWQQVIKDGNIKPE